MNIDALKETADWLETSDFGTSQFDMGNYQQCVLGQCAARQLKNEGQPVTLENTSLRAPGLALSVFGIRKTEQPNEWEFAFGAQWGSNVYAAAYRLRDLARNKVAPPRTLWHLYHSVPHAAHTAHTSDTLEPQLAII